MAFGGSVPPGSNLVESYDGTSWSEVNELNNGRTYPDGAGTATAGLAIGGGGGSTPTTAGYTESWDGTNWTEVADLTRGPSSGPQSTVYGMASGIQTSALYYGGDEGSSNTLAKTESWDGSSWTEVADLAQTNKEQGGMGNRVAALSVGGWIGSVGAVVYEWDWTATLAAGAWASGGNMNTGRDYVAGAAASNSSALIVGGTSNVTESYNGSSWTEVNDMNSPAAIAYARMPMGTATANILAGGGSLACETNPTAGLPLRRLCALRPSHCRATRARPQQRVELRDARQRRDRARVRRAVEARPRVEVCLDAHEGLLGEALDERDADGGPMRERSLIERAQILALVPQAAGGEDMIHHRGRRNGDGAAVMDGDRPDAVERAHRFAKIECVKLTDERLVLPAT